MQGRVAISSWRHIKSWVAYYCNRADNAPFADSVSEFFDRAQQTIKKKADVEAPVNVDTGAVDSGSEVIGVVIENVDDTDLYIDFGGKFHCVCRHPKIGSYPRGALVHLQLVDPEMTNKFLINTKGISLCEADAKLRGRYRGNVIRSSTDPADHPKMDTSNGEDSFDSQEIETYSTWIGNWQLL